ncbi:MAG: hypothetical protein FJ146_13325 [Deltaproteobacteria bacterium]|nr:hypothetical protein [Deltaproteobacteria bacterium]
MSEAHASHEHHGATAGHHHEPHAPSYYVKIWAVLLVLLVISITGPMLGNKILTLITAFGIAVVKALIVAAFFMHLNVEKKYIWYVLLTMLTAVAMFYFGVVADVQQYKGTNWTKPASYQYDADMKKAHEAAAGEHGGSHGAAADGGATDGAPAHGEAK